VVLHCIRSYSVVICVLCGTMWYWSHWVVLDCIRWYSVVLCDTMWFYVILYRIMSYSGVFGGSRLYYIVFNGIRRVLGGCMWY
jgi:hypothetical protein